jgi:hypothetical protein
MLARERIKFIACFAVRTNPLKFDQPSAGTRIAAVSTMPSSLGRSRAETNLYGRSFREQGIVLEARDFAVDCPYSSAAVP